MSPSLLGIMFATVLAASGGAVWAARAARGTHGTARALAARGTDDHQIARRLRLAEDVVALSIAHSRVKR